MDRRAWLPVVGVVVAATTILLVAFTLRAANGASLTGLLRDPNAARGAPWHVGSLSLAGVVVWASSSTTAIFAATQARTEHRTLRWFGVLGVVLALDDGLMLHEAAIPQLVPAGLTELVVFGLYGAVAAGIAWRWWPHLTPRGRAFGWGLAAAFGASMAVDLIDYGRLWVEDGLKFIGIACWAGLAFVESSAALRSR